MPREIRECEETLGSVLRALQASMARVEFLESEIAKMLAQPKAPVGVDLKAALLELLGASALSVNALVFAAKADQFALVSDPRDPDLKAVSVNTAMCKNVDGDVRRVAEMLSGRRVAIYTATTSPIIARAVSVRLAEFRRGRWGVFRFEE